MDIQLVLHFIWKQKDQSHVVWWMFSHSVHWGINSPPLFPQVSS